ncbi:hypothetical protein PQU92_04075 [Asticcacaulis sp. BYS171W]|uniref:Uncharacterized protein n=1 Tax=Asticcacaulis aquaticus TaxID=2984212 RepID=A0ABT5HQT2_9CAUL|nr:hypothetical protein [Asticcacaulis aquaticus]MDC7682438.1 hypothetical protein [Asticcacaulis aquaticus]
MNLKGDNLISFAAKLVGGAILFAIVFKGKIDGFDYELPSFLGAIGLLIVVIHNLIKNNYHYPDVSFKFSNFFSLFYFSILIRNIFAAAIFITLGFIFFDLFDFNFNVSVYEAIILFTSIILFSVFIDRFEIYSYKKLLQKRGVPIIAIEKSKSFKS